MLRKDRIEHTLNQELNPTYLEIINESANHNVPKGAETHFKVITVSMKFSDLTKIARHRLLHHLLNKEFELGLHALSMHLYTPQEWENNKTILNSPACRDGYKNK